MIISSVITFTSYSISACVYLICGKNEKIIPFVAGLLLFLVQTDYTLSIHYNLGILSQVLFFLLCLKTEKYLKGWIPVLLIPSWYILTGGFCWIFLITFTIYLIIYKARTFTRIVMLWIIMILTIIASGNFLFFESKESLLFFPMELPAVQLTRMFFIIILCIVVLLPVISRINFPVPNFVSASYNSESIIRSVIILLFLLLIGVYSYDRKNKHYFHVEKLFYEGKFDDIIKYNTRYPSANSLTLFFNNIALEEKGILNDRLFGFLQSPDGKTLFLKWEMVTEMLKRGAYFYYTTGMINEAHRWAFENMVMTGHTPEGLKMLIRTELINGNYMMAAKYISLLKKTLFYRGDALRFEKLLFNDPAVESDKDLGIRRKNRVKTDFFSITDDPSINIELINSADSLNRNAFDIKIAWLLLKKDYKGLADNFTLFEKLGYKSFPVHVEEALLAIATLNDGVSPYQGNLRISPLTQERWTQFLTVFQQYGNDLKAAEPALRRQFGNTFWYWAFYK